MIKIISVPEMEQALEEGYVIFQGGSLLWRDRDTKELKTVNFTTKVKQGEDMLELFKEDFNIFETWRVGK